MVVYIAELRCLVSSCDIENATQAQNLMIRDRITCGMMDDHLQQRFQQEWADIREMCINLPDSGKDRCAVMDMIKPVERGHQVKCEQASGSEELVSTITAGQRKVFSANFAEMSIIIVRRTALNLVSSAKIVTISTISQQEAFFPNVK